MAVENAVSCRRPTAHRARHAVREFTRRLGRRPLVILLPVVAAAGIACGGVADEGKLPPDVQDPATLKTPSGAMARYRGALALLPETFDHFLTETGIMTDELASLAAPTGIGNAYTAVDSRTDFQSLEEDYNRLHRLRTDMQEARGFVQTYAPDSSAALAGHLYAVQGYAEVLLADLFCSGIPLSTVEFDGDYTLQPGSSTADVYRHAITLFDSALALTADSVRLPHLAAVGRGRAFLALGQYAEAAAAVAAVPDNYAYQVVYRPIYAGDRLLQTLANGGGQGRPYPAAWPNMGNQEGDNGLDYRTSSDPRTPADSLGQDVYSQTVWFPAKYPKAGSVTLTLADGLEARLIEAEAALNAETGDWLTKLNALRTDGSYDTQPNADDPSKTDTLWHAGTGQVPGLRPLDDPGTSLSEPAADSARLDLVFRERAFWLYLTGHRQGDLRRLVRVYLRRPEDVYPTGVYPGGRGMYGAEVVAPVPATEQQLNPMYTGCFHHHA